MFTPVNIVTYNVLSSSGGGAELYGTEPWFYYLFNLFLNFNFILVAALTAIPLFVSDCPIPLHPHVLIFVSFPTKQVISRVCTSASSSVTRYHVTVISCLILWALVFVPQAHKEERFMFPVYPLICLSAGLAIEVGIEVAACIHPRLSSLCLNVSLAFLMLSAGLSISRGAALYKGFSAPIDVYWRLEPINDKMNHILSHDWGRINVCVGKEWHRFPSSFFLPDDKWRIRFLKSEFAGQLPKHFSERGVKGTRTIPDHMNDQNKEEFDRYVGLDECHFVVDTEYPEWHGHDVPYAQDERLDVVGSEAFLDSGRTPFPYRSFYLPWFSERKWHMINYSLLVNRNTTSEWPLVI